MNSLQLDLIEVTLSTLSIIRPHRLVVVKPFTPRTTSEKMSHSQIGYHHYDRRYKTVALRSYGALSAIVYAERQCRL